MKRLIAATGALLAAVLPSAVGRIVPNPLFNDHAVLQAGAPLPVWGKAEPGESVRVQLLGHSVTATADVAGNWRAVLPPMQSAAPAELTLAGNRGEEPFIARDVLIGEVWVGSGQSNMDFSVSAKVKRFAGTRDEAAEIAAANYPEIRMFVGDPVRTAEPKATVPGHWEVCSPATAPAFSAVGYFFARDLQRVIHRPVGMLILSYGASTAEAWVSREALAADPALSPMLERFDAAMKSYRERPAAVPAPPAPAVGSPSPRRRRAADPDPEHNQHNPTVLYNGMIAPVLGYGMRGAIWYQGESIVGGAEGRALYPRVQSALVRDWRSRWGEGEFPFYIVQLAGQEAESNSPWVREAQATVLTLPNTGMAVAYDIGEPHNVHPKDKQDVGDRLARIALRRTYGVDVEDSGPLLAGWRRDGDQIELNFEHAEGLRTKGGSLAGFVIAGADRRFHRAEARIEGISVVVRAEDVPQPEAVRYAWTNYPADANLCNAAGLPAAPFRTDRW